VVDRFRDMIGWGRFIDRCWGMIGSRFIHWLWLMVDRLWLMVDRLRFMIDRFWRVIWGRFWSWMVGSRFWCIARSRRMVGFLLRIMRSSLISDLSNISIVMVSGVLDMLDSSIRKLNRVGATDNISIRCLSSSEVGLAVVISYSILIAVRFWWVFLLFMVDRFWLVVDRFWRMVGSRFGSWWVVGSRFRTI